MVDDLYVSAAIGRKHNVALVVVVVVVVVECQWSGENYR
jgi:hypothetical protein